MSKILGSHLAEAGFWQQQEDKHPPTKNGTIKKKEKPFGLEASSSRRWSARQASKV